MEKGQESKQRGNTAYHHSDKPRVRQKIRRVFKRYGYNSQRICRVVRWLFPKNRVRPPGWSFWPLPIRKGCRAAGTIRKDHGTTQRGDGSGAPASPSCPGTDRQATPSAGTDRPCCRRKSKGRSQKRRTRKGDCPAALRKLRFAGVQRKGIPGTMPDTWWTKNHREDKSKYRVIKEHL